MTYGPLYFEQNYPESYISFAMERNCKRMLEHMWHSLDACVSCYFCHFTHTWLRQDKGAIFYGNSSVPLNHPRKRGLRNVEHWFLLASMMTSSNGNIFRVTGHLCGEFTGTREFPAQRPVTQSFDVFFDLRLNKRLSKLPWGWWSEMLSRPLWRHCNGIGGIGGTNVFCYLACFFAPHRSRYPFATANDYSYTTFWYNTLFHP